MYKQLKSLCKGALSVDKIHTHFSHRDIHVHYIKESNFQPKQLLSRSRPSYAAAAKSSFHVRQLTFNIDTLLLSETDLGQ